MSTRRDLLLHLAREAVKYAQTHISLGPTNSIVWNFGTLPKLPYRFYKRGQQKDRSDELTVQFVRAKGGTKVDPDSYIRAMAQSAKEFKIGNCGEHAALAFEYLADKGVRPLDFVTFRDGDHAFVVLDRKEGADIADLSAWLPQAVLCDPWRGGAHIGEMARIWYRNQALQVEYRLA